MPSHPFKDASHLYSVMQKLFARVQEVYPKTAASFRRQKLILHFHVPEWELDITLNGKFKPISLTDAPPPEKASLKIEGPVEVMDTLLRGDVSVAKAMRMDGVTISGSLWRVTALLPILHKAQNLYEDVLGSSESAVPAT